MWVGGWATYEGVWWVEYKIIEVWGEAEVVESAHSLEVSQLEARIGEFERDLGKTASSLPKEKKAKKSKNSEVRHKQCQLQSGGRSTSCGIEDARAKVKIALCRDFQSHLRSSSNSLDSLLVIHDSDIGLAVIEGSIDEVELLQGNKVTL